MTDKLTVEVVKPRKIVLSPEELDELLSHKELASCFREVISTDEAVTVKEAFKTARYLMKVLKLQFPDIPDDAVQDTKQPRERKTPPEETSKNTQSANGV